MKQAFIEILSSTVDERRPLFSAVASDVETRAEKVRLGIITRAGDEALRKTLVVGATSWLHK